MNKAGTYALRLLLLLLALGVTLGGVEVGLRVLRPELGWHNVADTDLGWSSREYQRFDPLKPPKFETRNRLLVMGDSNLAGAALRKLRQRFPQVLAARRGKDDIWVRILAAGGWGTDQQLLAFEEKGAAWDPDLVIVAFTPFNDLANVLSSSNRPDHLKPYFVLDPQTGAIQLHDEQGRPVDEDAEQQVEASEPSVESYLLTWLRSRWRASRGDPVSAARLNGAIDPRYLLYADYNYPVEKKLPGLHELLTSQGALGWSPQLGVNSVMAWIHEDFPLNTYAWALMERILERYRDAVEGAGARFVLMLLPVPLLTGGDPELLAGGSFERVYQTPDGPFTLRAAEPVERLAAICERLGIEFFDPSADFIARVKSDPELQESWWIEDDAHVTVEGHAVLAELLDDYLGEL